MKERPPKGGLFCWYETKLVLKILLKIFDLLTP